MGFNNKLLFSLVVAVPLMVNAFVWNVGDDAGWSGQAQFDYTHWAVRPMFLVGDDGLRFVYNPDITNVVEVTYCAFKSCDATSPLVSYNTGDDTVPITKLHQYFISGNPDDCNNGLKLDIPAYNSSYARFWRPTR
ncbi:mavicyanin-like [Papaver somniferum]|nr:mavicyanin-like [Papaver somniferum]